MYVYRQPYGNELMHYGILGMKWGVRRYQNPDGTLTAAGKKRYLNEGSDSPIDLTRAGQKAERKAYDKLYGKGSFDRRGKEQLAQYNKAANEAYNNKSSEELKVQKDLASQAADQMHERQMNEVKNGRYFTDEYFRAEKATVAMDALASAANDVLKERGRLFEEAQKNDRYSLDYLEMTPDDWNDRSEKDRLSDYKSWLDDPKRWRESR